MKQLTQMTVEQWPPELTEEIAVLKEEPDDFERRGLLAFQETYDDLDYFKAAIVVRCGGRAFALKRYRNCPAPGVSLIVEKDSPEGLREQLKSSLEALVLEPDSITWMRYDIP